MRILITGAQFNNKGAQSLLFTLINEMCLRFEDCEFYYLPIDNCFNYHPDEYLMHIVYDDMAWKDNTGTFKDCVRYKLVCIKQEIKWYTNIKKHFSRLSNVLDIINVMIDISGFALSSKISKYLPSRYLRLIKASKEKGIPVVLMPQSFGPFDYGINKGKYCKEIYQILKSVDYIYARELEGARLLRDDIGIEENVLISPDLVLQSETLECRKIYKKEPLSNVRKIESSDAIGIIPNTQLLKNCSKDYLLNIYKRIIEALIKNNKEVYIFRHSNDLLLCKDIFNMFNGDERIHIIIDEMNCVDFGKFVSQFQFVVASRYHSIIHSYRQDVPAIILGWATKYKDLANLVGQADYVFDLSSINESTMIDLQNKITQLCDRVDEEADVIRSNLINIRNESKLSLAWDLLSEIDKEGNSHEN